MARKRRDAEGNPGPARLSIRIDFGPGQRIGPGKILLLEQIGEHGSIAAGGRALAMSYRRAWQLVDDLNRIFGQPVVTSQSGGKQGGGAALTALGLQLIRRYRALEKAAGKASAADMTALNAAIARGQNAGRG